MMTLGYVLSPDCSCSEVAGAGAGVIAGAVIADMLGCRRTVCIACVATTFIIGRLVGARYPDNNLHEYQWVRVWRVVDPETGERLCITEMD